MPIAKNIGICAPSRSIGRGTADQIIAYAASHFPDVVLKFHEQCFAQHGHFAGTDDERLSAFVEMANNPELNAIWFARGGYGAARIASRAITQLGDAARSKTYIGYSDAGNMLGGLYRAGFAHVVHGPMVNDITRRGGDVAIGRAMAWLSSGNDTALEPGLSRDHPQAAFNLVTLAMMLATDLMPDLSGHMLLIEEVEEYHYAIDRALGTVTAALRNKGLAGIRMGRFSQIPDNNVDFAMTAEDITQHWCEQAGIPYLGRADIGHDIGNKVVPFGRLQ